MIQTEQPATPAEAARHLHGVILYARDNQLWAVLRGAVAAYQALCNAHVGYSNPSIDDDVRCAIADMERHEQPPVCRDFMNTRRVPSVYAGWVACGLCRPEES